MLYIKVLHLYRKHNNLLNNIMGINDNSNSNNTHINTDSTNNTDINNPINNNSNNTTDTNTINNNNNTKPPTSKKRRTSISSLPTTKLSAEHQSQIDELLSPIGHRKLKNDNIKFISAELYTDGASRGNPGQSGAGTYIHDTINNKFIRCAEYLGLRTNNNLSIQHYYMV